MKSSVQAVSSGRVILGAVAVYLEGELEALGANFDQRTAIADEALVAIKQAWRVYLDEIAQFGDEVLR